MADPETSPSGLLVAVGAAVLVFLLVAPNDLVLGQDDFAAAAAAATTDADTADGKKFAEALGETFGHEHGRTIQQCARQSKRPDLSDFDILVRVDGTGVVDQALVKPTTTLATCVVGKLLGWKAVVPPHVGFWVKIGVNLKST